MDKYIRLKLASLPFPQYCGFIVGMGGGYRDQNPIIKDTEAWRLWDQGFSEGVKARKEARDEPKK